MPTIDVLDSTIHYQDRGSGTGGVLNPLSDDELDLYRAPSPPVRAAVRC